LLATTIASIIIPPLIMLFFRFSIPAGDEMDMDFFMVGMTSYLAIIVFTAMNYSAILGISREGRNFAVLKSLPISAVDIVRFKLMTAGVVTAACSVLVAIVFFFVSSTYNPIVALLTGILIFSSSFAMNCSGLLNDMRNPNLRWKNINELTRNNTKTLKPILFAVLIGLVYMITAIIMAVFQQLHVVWRYLIFFGTTLLFNVWLVSSSYRRLFEKPQELFNNIEV
jgi:ABC-2 type transport system permease protein